MNSAIPSEGSMQTSWPALRNINCADQIEYQDRVCHKDGVCGCSTHAMLESWPETPLSRYFLNVDYRCKNGNVLHTLSRRL